MVCVEELATFFLFFVEIFASVVFLFGFAAVAALVVDFFAVFVCLLVEVAGCGRSALFFDAVFLLNQETASFD